MSEERVLCSHVLTVRFDQLEGNRINWYVQPDEQVKAALPLSLVDLAECDAPLAVMGIHALWKLCVDGLVHNALEQANGIQAAVHQRLSVAGPGQLIEGQVEGAPKGVTIN